MLVIYIETSSYVALLEKKQTNIYQSKAKCCNKQVLNEKFGKYHKDWHACAKAWVGSDNVLLNNPTAFLFKSTYVA